MEQYLLCTIHPFKEVGVMIRQFLLGAAFAGAMLLGISAANLPLHAQAQSGNQSPAAANAVSGKVTAIGNGGHSFTLEVSTSSTDKRTLEFVVDQNTRVQGKVTVGTAVAVQYQIVQGGQKLALSVTAQA
jgi:hypothetical protein